MLWRLSLSAFISAQALALRPPLALPGGSNDRTQKVLARQLDLAGAVSDREPWR